MTTTPNLSLPFIDANQSQKHVTHNSALQLLDTLVELSAISDSLATPPGSPADGDRYIVAASPTGAWTGQAGKIAAWISGAWTFLTPRTGWRAWIASRSAAVVYSGTAWQSEPSFGFRNLLRNAGLTINQRAVSGTVTLAAGAYGHDGLRAGASGATYTFATVGVDTQVTVTAGSLIMPIEAGMVEGGVYTLSQAGTAQARVWQGTGYSGSGTYAACPFQTGALTANTQTNVEFSTGTILRPQFERGAFATSFERRLPTVELNYCKRYFNRVVGSLPNTFPICFGAFNTTTTGYGNILFPTMRVTPTPSIATGSLTISSSGGSVSSINLLIGGPNTLTFQAVGTGFTPWSPLFFIGNSASPLTSIDLNAELP